ncbi:MAG: hypothetical protein ACYDCK_05860 [Thermoplasmatota archaeon]
MDRRTFVKGCIGAAALAGIGGATYSMAAAFEIPRRGGSTSVRYFGAQRVGGPAPRGVPIIPIFVNKDGNFEGKPLVLPPGVAAPASDVLKDPVQLAAFLKLNGGYNVLDWYKYCGHVTAPGLEVGFQTDNVLRYYLSQEKIAAINPWYKNLIGEPVRPEHFPGTEFGAGINWRSEGQSGSNVLSGVIINYPEKAIHHVASGLLSPASAVTDPEYAFIRSNFHSGNFVAQSTFCTHFCCVPGFHENEALAKTHFAADGTDAWNKMYCTCHNSIYDPSEPVAYSFVPDPLPIPGHITL